MEDENRKMVLDILKAYNEKPSSEMDLIAALLGSIATSLAVIADNMERKERNA